MPNDDISRNDKYSEAAEAAFEKWWQKWRAANCYSDTPRMRDAARAVYESLAYSSIDTMVEQLREQGHLNAPRSAVAEAKDCPTCGGDGKLTDEPGTFKDCHTCAGCGKVVPFGNRLIRASYGTRSSEPLGTVQWPDGMPRKLHIEERIKQALDRIRNGQAPMRIPADETDPDWVLADCLTIFRARSATLPRWIPVTERLPEDGTLVCVSDESGQLSYDYREKGAWMRVGEDCGEPVEWMPLPHRLDSTTGSKNG